MTRPVKISAAILLLILASQTIFSMRTKSPTCDEFAHHLANGYSYLVTHDFRMNPASPALSRMLPAVPLLFFKANLPLNHPSWETIDSPEFARQFFYHANTNCVDKFVFWSRIPIVLVSILFGLVVFLWSRRLFGSVGGFVSLVLYVFSPNILAHSGLATADLMVAFFFFLSFITFWSYLRSPSLGRAALVAAAVAGAFLSKFSAVLLLPILLIIAVLSRKIRFFKVSHWALFTLMVFFVIWAGYFFEFKPLLQHTPDPPKKIAFLQKLGGPRLVEFAEKVPIPLATFSSAIVCMGFTRAAGTNAYLLGQWSTEGWWYYYFVAFLIKETIPFILLILLGFLFISKLSLDRLTKIVIVAPIILFFAATLHDKAQAGIRYFLPLFPLFFVLAGGAAAFLWNKSRLWKWLIIALLSWHALEAAIIYPNYLAYFNELVGGPKNGYKYLRDSNIDWAQDLKGLGKYVVKQGYPEVVLLYHGIEDPQYYKIPYRWPDPDEYLKPRATVYALGVHHIDTMKWFEKYKPVATIGYSMYVYDLRKEKL